MERSDCGYDFDEQEYLKDYQRFLEEIRKVVVGLTKVYSVTMIKAILTMWVCEGSVSDRLKTQYSNNVLLLDALRKKPLITAGMRLGEGTGAVAAMPLLDMARAVYMDCYTFEEGGIEAYTPQGGEG